MGFNQETSWDLMGQSFVAYKVFFVAANVQNCHVVDTRCFKQQSWAINQQ
jgi:hypothetical protein